MSRLDHLSKVGASVGRRHLISNARSLPSSRTAVGQVQGRMLDPAGWFVVTIAVKVWFTVSTEITFTCSSLAGPNSKKTKSTGTGPLVKAS